MSKDELEEYLDALDRHECYRVDKVLKDSPIERTERVFYEGKNGSEQGPFIRKAIASESGQGRMYQKIFRAQQAGKRLAHIPHIHECYSTGNSLEVIIEFVEGQTLQEYVEEQGPSRKLAEHIFPALCDAVSELHEAFDPPIIHRDLTPANIIVSESGVTVIDLGIAREFHPGAMRDTVYFGTRDFAPPEQFGFAQTDIRSDVYAMGKLLRYCLEGAAITGDIPDSAAENARASDRDRALDQQDARLQAVVEKATNLDPAMRYSSAAQLKEAFLEACAGSKVQERGSVGNIAPNTASSKSINVDHDEASKAANVSGPVNRQGSGDFAVRLSRVLGTVWTVFVLLVWVLLFVISIGMVLEPEGDLAKIPLWARVFEVYGIAFIPFTIVAYFLLDLRLIREKLPELKLPSRRKTWYIALAAIIVLWAVVQIIGTLAGL